MLTTKTDKRGVEYIEDASYDDLRFLLPDGWALCPTCDRAWDDTKSTSVTPTPSGRCPFEHLHRVSASDYDVAYALRDDTYFEIPEG